MNNIDNYIEYFATCINNEKAGEGIIEKGYLPHIKYAEEVSSFLKDFYNSDLIDGDYAKNFASLESKEGPTVKSSLNDLKTYLTNIIRTERFCEGHLYKNIVNGNLHELLVLIKEKNS